MREPNLALSPIGETKRAMPITDDRVFGLRLKFVLICVYRNLFASNRIMIDPSGFHFQARFLRQHLEEI